VTHPTVAETARAPGRGLRYLPSLDGIRGIGILTVIAFHSGFSFIPGGFYCVESYFVLSGYLVCSLLLIEWQRTGGIGLGHFWSRRARRLLPALYVMLVFVGVGAVVWPSVLGYQHLYRDTLATVFYAANWNLIAQHAEYFSVTVAPSPLQHCWTLAIEEQFYLVLPLALLLLFKVRRHRRPDERGSVPPMHDQPVTDAPAPAAGAPLHETNRSNRRRLIVLFVGSFVLAVASAAWMWILTPTGSDPTRAYYGTDTRAQGVLVGVCLSAAVALWAPIRSRWQLRSIVVLGFAGVVGTAVLWATVKETSSFAYHGGFFLADLCWFVIIASMTQVPRGWVPRAIGVAPLRFIGRISYGMYLWYWVLVLIISPPRVHLPPLGLFLLRLGSDIIIATASSRLVELPIRRGAFRPSRAMIIGATAATLAIVAAAVSGLPGMAEAGAGPTPNQVSRPTGPVKIMFVGDSMSGTLAVGLSEVERSYGVEIANAAYPACSMTLDQQLRAFDSTIDPLPPCKTGDPDHLLSLWQQWVDDWNPDVVVYLSGTDVDDLQINGRWTNIGQPDFDAWINSRYRQGIAVLGSRGADVVLLTLPYFLVQDNPATGQQYPESNPARVTQLNQFLISVAAAARKSEASHVVPDNGGGVNGGLDGDGGVSSFDLAGLVSPGQTYSSDVGGIRMRCLDNFHISVSGGEEVARTLLPVLAADGARHHVASPGGTWPGGKLPTNPPTWWPNLRCGV